jgi:hypothetical protein
MSKCTHKTLTLLKERSDRLRCRKCHLVISAEELGGGCCPECYAVSGERHYDFEELSPSDPEVTKYRCDQCGALIEWKPL